MFDMSKACLNHCHLCPPTVCCPLFRSSHLFLNHSKGTQSFHNFHRLSPKALKSMNGKPTNNDNVETEEEEETVIEGGGGGVTAETTSENTRQSSSAVDISGVVSDADGMIKSSTTDSASSSSSSTTTDVINIIGDNWIPKPRERSEVTRGIIFACEIVEGNTTESESNDASSDDLIRIRIRGQSFLLHQVRYEQTIHYSNTANRLVERKKRVSDHPIKTKIYIIRYLYILNNS